MLLFRFEEDDINLMPGQPTLKAWTVSPTYMSLTLNPLAWQAGSDETDP